ncbi:ABC transporter substrate-binding protein [Aurantimonas sp. MSK8Z-1]|uniref:ABC transporter substrate-binding protein n=1 Tax=Mangrovibrevibacter kandeliae TaxID=2968473 RepID=UPI00211810E8|nr:ABC transporter substrate-binding protein [Aurantimonas sp. MSK8Z-1]MCW4114933.1 ABC transporter substrate-binding protein [Aurantimonas sp. MSK8Z-1]
MKNCLSLVLAAALASAALPATANEVINVAIIGEPDTLDPMVSTKDVVSIVTQHVVETLYTFDSSWAVAPLLAEDLPTIADDGKTYDIKLREGISFSDGSAMDSADVVASLQRWLKVASRGKVVADKVESVTAKGMYEIEIKMSSPYAPLLSLLAFSNSAAAIYPEEILPQGDGQIADVVGTGPYKYGEHVPDQYLQLVRFDGFVPRDEPANGGSGKRGQVPDEIRFVPVPDPNTRVEGLLSGQFDFADSLPAESYDRVASSDKAKPVLLEPFGWPIWAINHKAGLLSNQKIRQALLTALPFDDMLFAAFGNDKFFKVDGAMYPQGWAWNTDAGTELYDQNDPDKAGELLEEAGYDGTPLRILTSRQYEFHYKMAEVAKQALEAAGFKVQMDVVDWATLGQRRDDPSLWDIYISHSPFLPEPALTDMWFASSRVGWSEPEKDKLADAFVSETDPEKRKAIFAELQKKNYEDVGFIKVGNFNALLGEAKSLEGVDPSPWPYFWNAAKK